jgi:hypothetical protein
VPEHSTTGEVAERLQEQKADKKEGNLAVEIVEGALLAVVAVTTAFSGYQSALWDSKSVASYGLSSKLRVASQGAQTTAGQQMLYDSTTFDAWLVAAEANNTELKTFLERRFRPEYRVAFDAWIQTDPLHNSLAPPGPAFMPQYKNASAAQASQLDKESTAAFDAGNRDRDIGDEYVRVTVLLAVVLFLTALSQRFDIRKVRIGIIGTALVVLAYSLFSLATVGT